MSRFGAIVLILVGLLFLLSNLGLFHFSHLGGFLRTWWPLVLIVIGLAALIGKK